MKNNYSYGKENKLRNINILEEVIENNKITNTDVTMLINKISIKESDEIGRCNTPKLDVEIHWNTPFVDLKELA